MKVTDIAQALRTSHCDRDTDKHKCIGVCTISPQGVKLDCTLCGAAAMVITGERGYDKLEKILSFIGVNPAYLDPYVVKSMLEEMNRKDK